MTFAGVTQNAHGDVVALLTCKCAHTRIYDVVTMIFDCSICRDHMSLQDFLTTYKAFKRSRPNYTDIPPNILALHRKEKEPTK